MPVILFTELKYIVLTHISARVKPQLISRVILIVGALVSRVNIRHTYQSEQPL